MLAKNNFLTLLNDPSEVNEEDIQSISSIIKSYPYFLSARLLKVKGLKNINAIEYESYLRQTASYTPNRETLYHLLMQEELQDKIKEAEAEKNIVQKEEISDTTKTNEKKEILNDTQNPTNKSESAKKQVSEIEQLILEEAVNTSLAFELETNSKPMPPSSEPQIIVDAEKKVEKTSNEAQPTSFTSWLKSVNHTNSATENTSNSSIENLIDKFIQKEPRIGETKKEFFTPEQMARLSLVEDPDFVTETLAKIYAQQGAFNKAISAFKKLSLKYPEKRTYFAAQIKNLEQQLKQK